MAEPRQPTSKEQLTGPRVEQRKIDEQHGELIRVKKVEVLNKIKNGQDQEGAFLAGSFIDAITNTTDRPGKKVADLSVTGIEGEMNLLYRTAQKIAEVDDKKDVDWLKLHNTLDGLYKIAHLDGGQYEIKIPEGTPPQDRNRLIQGQMVKDLNAYGERATYDHLMKNYVELKSQAGVKEDQLKIALTKDSLSRREVSKYKYELDRAENRIVNHVEVKLTALYPDKRSPMQKILGEPPSQMAEYLELKHARLHPQPEEGAPTTPEVTIPPEEKIARKQFRTEQFKKDLVENQGDRVGETFDHLQEIQREQLMSDLTSAEENLQQDKSQLEKIALGGDPEAVCEQLQDVKARERDLKVQKSKIESALAAQRKIDATGQWKAAMANLGTTIGTLKGWKEIGADTGKVISAGKEWVSSRVGGMANWFKGKLSPVINKASEIAQSAGEFAQKVQNYADEKVTEGFREIGTSTITAIQESNEEFWAVDTSIRTENRNRRWAFKNWRGEQYDKINKTRKKAWVNIGMNLRMEKNETRMWVGDTLVGMVGGDKSKIEAAKQSERNKVANAWEHLHERIDREKNPHLQWFVTNLDKHVSYLKPGEEAEAVTPADEASIEARTNRARQETVEQRREAERQDERNLESEANKLFTDTNNQELIEETDGRAKDLGLMLEDFIEPVDNLMKVGRHTIGLQTRNLRVASLALEKMFTQRMSGTDGEVKNKQKSYNEKVKSLSEIALQIANSDDETEKKNLLAAFQAMSNNLNT